MYVLDVDCFQVASSKFSNERVGSDIINNLVLPLFEVVKKSDN